MRSDATFSLNKLFPTALFVVPRLFLCSVKFNNMNQGLYPDGLIQTNIQYLVNFQFHLQ